MQESIKGADVTEGLQGGRVVGEAPRTPSRVSVAGEGSGKAQEMPVDSRVGADGCMEGGVKT